MGCCESGGGERESCESVELTESYDGWIDRWMDATYSKLYIL